MNTQFTPIPGTNVAINWATIPGYYQFVTVNDLGAVQAHIIEPELRLNSYWSDGVGSLFICDVNEKPYNWQTLIFERPQQTTNG